MRFVAIAFCSLWFANVSAQTCPITPSIIYSNHDVLALRLFAAQPVLFSLDKINQQPQTQITSERRNQVSGAVSTVESIGTTWSGVLLKDFLLKNGIETIPNKALRNSRIEILATDGYRATFSWGEVFNSQAGSQTLIITKQDGMPLNSQEGPVSFRALSDIRPGPRHVRNVCAITLLD